ncbi:hypothetical protein PR202_gb27480 [Eleusine coracana subsp. coracana]|uniref:Protein pleiotropic regulatory locus 1 n=1 Tax=Eleusine coracana subsp. coracana TaxID=191504 RepID=A0AAV5FUV8_ELECO|nr:hypothetical protein PR202_gb27480 [Eleusine coracana subsp. coracana]
MATNAADGLPVEPQSLKKLSLKSLKRSLDFFAPRPLPPLSRPTPREDSHRVQGEGGVRGGQGSADGARARRAGQDGRSTLVVDGIGTACESTIPGKNTTLSFPGSSDRFSTSALMERIPSRWPRPVWHAPWKNYRVISGHLGWVRSIAFDPGNEWFCTGSADRTIKIWDLASGTLKLTLTGHIEQVRGLAVSQRHTYLFSAGDDKQVKCWDLEQNKVIRSYHGHLSGVYCLALHPTIDILLTGGRDSVCRVWDIRTKAHVSALTGHDNTVCSVFARPTAVLI